MPSIKPQSRAIEGALKTRGEFSIEKHAGLCLISRGDGNGSFVLRYRAPSGGKKAAYTLTGDARSVLNSGPVDGLSGLEHLYRRTNQILTDLKVSKVDPRAVDIARKASGRTYSDLFEEWHERHAKREKRERSWRDDRDIYERHIKPRIGADTLTEIKVGADSGEGGQCLRFKADSITVIADTCSRRRLEGSQIAIFSSSAELVL